MRDSQPEGAETFQYFHLKDTAARLSFATSEVALWQNETNTQPKHKDAQL